MHFGILNGSFKHVVDDDDDDGGGGGGGGAAAAAAAVSDDDAKFEVISGKFNIHGICVK